MTKICPIMSFHHPGAEVKCLQERCMAWKRCQQPENCTDCEYQPPAGSICPGTNGYCALIED